MSSQQKQQPPKHHHEMINTPPQNQKNKKSHKRKHICTKTPRQNHHHKNITAKKQKHRDTLCTDSCTHSDDRAKAQIDSANRLRTCAVYSMTTRKLYTLVWLKKRPPKIVLARNTMCEKPPERKAHLSKTHSNIPRKHVLNPIHKRFATAHRDVAKCRHCHYFPASQTALINKEGGVKDLFDKCPPIMFSEENGFLRACQDKATLRIMNGLFAKKMKETAEPTMISTEHEGTQMILRSLHGDLHQYSIFFCRFTSIQDTRCSWYNLCRAGLTLLDVGENAFVKLDY